MNQPIVDSHIHYWAPDHLRYDWLSSTPAINQPFLPETLQAESEGYDLQKIVFVEADAQDEQGIAEAQWVSDLAAMDQRIEGIVAFAPLEQGNSARYYLDRLAALPLVKGVRRLIQSEELGFSTQPNFVAGVQTLSQYGFSFDLCIYHPQLPDIIQLVEQCPDVSFVLDHIGKPDIAKGLLDPWREQIESLAAFDNVQCKISGLITEAEHTNWTPEDLQPYIEHIIASFGIERVMYGGDWPVSLLASSSWTQWVDVLSKTTDHLSADNRHKLFFENARQFYRLS